MAEKTDYEVASDGLPSVNIPTIDKRWISHDLQILLSGLFADAEIICEGDSTPRKVHRNILSGRSVWFKKAFSGDFTEAIERKVNLQETPWSVDLMLYFFYTGGINMYDNALIAGHDQMAIGIELLRLGDFFQSTSMLQYGMSMLAGYVAEILYQTCDTNVTSSANEARFKEKADLPKHLCDAIVNAFDKTRPVQLAQDMLADFVFAARIHLFNNEEFVSFIRDKVVPEFANNLLTTLITGPTSDIFDGHHVFKQWQHWQLTPRFAAPAQPVTAATWAPQGSAFGSGTAAPQVANMSGGGSQGFTNGSSTADPGRRYSGMGTGERKIARRRRDN